LPNSDASLRGGLWDADNHYYEPPDCFTRYLDPQFAGRGLQVVTDADGRERVVVDGRPFTFLLDPFSGTTSKPGSLREMLRSMAAERPAASDSIEPIQPEYVNREARLARMDEQGVEAILLFPTLAVCVEQFLKHDADLLYASFHAFNRWLADDWGLDHQGRIFGVPLLSLLDVERAVEELEFVLAGGARAIGLRPGPAYGRSPADPEFDPFWARVNEALVPVCFHIGESGYNELYSVAWGEEANPSSHRQSAFQWTSFYGDRPIMDTFSALVLHNLFGRFPNVQCISVENGSLWVPYLLKVMNKMNGMGRNGPWLGGRITTRPSNLFRDHVSVSPYHEEDISALVAVIGDDRVLFGSDYPHAEGLANPAEFADLVAPLGEDATRRIMRDNLRGLLGGIPVAA
jgi:predicted TIM-barrel fold metal-dependent hydrolase